MNDAKIDVKIAMFDGGGSVAHLSSVPLYHADRGAIIEVINRHFRLTKHRHYFMSKLERLVSSEMIGLAEPFDLLTATPRQLCIAFLQTIGEWRTN